MNRPAVSVVITTVNRPESVLRAIRSVFAQTYYEYDLHVIDDGSADRTPYAVKHILGERENAFYWRHEKCRGLSAARNTGIAKSTGDYIAFLDDDDEWKPDCIKKRMVTLQKLSSKEREKIGVVYCGCEIHILHENRITYNMPKIEGNIKKHIIHNDLSTIPSSCLFPKKVLQTIGGFDENLTSSIDHDIWMNLAVHGYHAFAVKEPLVITYSNRKRRSMVTDTSQRIRGVEQFLNKWEPVYQEWYGREDTNRYVLSYRTRVLGGLAGNKIASRKLREAVHLIRFVTGKSKWSISNSRSLAFIIARTLFRSFVPGKLIGLFKERKVFSYKKDDFST